MKLIDMTAFVIQIYNEFNTSDLIADKCFAYAKFLSQALTLGMFVPCDDDGNFLDEPKPVYESTSPYEDSEPKYDLIEVENYKKALSKVLFNGFEINDLSKEINIRLKHDSVYLFFDNQGIITSNGGYTTIIVQDLIPFNIDLAVTFKAQII